MRKRKRGRVKENERDAETERERERSIPNKYVRSELSDVNLRILNGICNGCN